MRDQRLPVKKRPGFFLLFVDLKKAFDSVPRALLIRKLLKHDFDKAIIKIIANMLTDTTMSINNEEFATNVGVPQGTCLAPVSVSYTHLTLPTKA